MIQLNRIKTGAQSTIARLPWATLAAALYYFLALGALVILVTQYDRVVFVVLSVAVIILAVLLLAGADFYIVAVGKRLTSRHKYDAAS